MTAYVLDASVVVKWFIPEAHSEGALRLKGRDARLHAPAVLTLELGNVLVKKRRRDELTRAEAEDIWNAFRQVPIRRHADDTLVLAAFDLAQQTRTALYDNLYLALGVELDIPFVTADRKFYQALQATPYRHKINWIEDL
ncbi:MAG: type II toxin-antitoxin system VapC family toxin [Nitrospira sp.]